MPLKVCNVCKKMLDRSNFSKRAASADGLNYTCRACSSARCLKWRDDNPGAYQEWAKDNEDRVRANWAEWSAKNKDHLKESYAHWAKKNKAKVNSRIAARVAAKLRATPAWADKEKIEAIYRIAAEMTSSTGIRHEVDHYYPLRGKTVCGLHCHENLRVITRSENARKKNKMPEECT